MPTVYLHIGMPKTGTTFLQKSLFDNREVLKKYGYDFPDIEIKFSNAPLRRNAHFLIPPVLTETGELKTGIDDKSYEAGMARIKEIIKDERNLILSDELIWVWSGEYLEHFRKEMEELGYNVKALVYLRRQDTFIQSYWNQLVKTASTKRAFSTFLTDEKTEYYKLDYQKGIQHFADIFGEENMIVRVYEKGQYGGRYKNLLSDFLEAVGLGDIDEEKEFVFNTSDKIKSNIVNPSLNGLYVHTKRLLDRNSYFCKKDDFSIYRLHEISLEDTNPKNTAAENLMTYEEKLEYLGRFKEGNKIVADKYLGGNGDSLFKDEIVNNDDILAKYSGIEVIDLCGEFIKREHEDYLAKCDEIAELKASLANYKRENALLSKEIRSLNSTIKKQQSAIEWMSASIPKKVARKLKRTFSSNKNK